MTTQQQMIRIKQEPDIDNEDDIGGGGSNIGIINETTETSSTVSSAACMHHTDTAAVNVKLEQSSDIEEEEDNNHNKNSYTEEYSTNRQCVIANELNNDDAVNSALQIITMIDVDTLSCENLREKVIKVQGLCNNMNNANSTASTLQSTTHTHTRDDDGDDDTAVSVSNSRPASPRKISSDDESSSAAITMNNDDNDNDLSKKIAANPLIGATIHVYSGIHRGLSGKFISQSHGWLVLDNPDIGTGVRFGHCKLVDDGEADINAIKKYCSQGNRHMLPIIKPDQLSLGEGNIDDRCCNNVPREVSERRESITNNEYARAEQQADEVVSSDDSIHKLLSSSNPLIGSTVYVSSGKYAGLSGKLVSEFKSWWKIDNPQILKNVHCSNSNCKIVDDGIADVQAIKKFCIERRRWMPPIMEPIQLKRPVEASSDSEETKKKKMRRGTGELAKLKDFLTPGCHYLPLQKTNNELDDINQSLRSRYSANSKAVIQRRWDEKESTAVLTVDRPTHYCSVPEQVSTIANQVKLELLQRFKPGWDGSNEHLATAYEVEENSGYYRGHLNNNTSLMLQDCLPGHFQIKTASQKIGIVFLNIKNGRCDCHFDRDSSALFLVSGYKEVKIAPPMKELHRPADGILEDVNPFSPDDRMHGGFQWETVHMGPGSVLVIPKYWLHCIRSIGNPHTLALSFQIQLSNDTKGESGRSKSLPAKRIWTSQDVSTGMEHSTVARESECQLNKRSSGSRAGMDDDGNKDECDVCGDGGDLICCDGCDNAYHEECLEITADTLPDPWHCPRCANDSDGENDKKISANEKNTASYKRMKAADVKSEISTSKRSSNRIRPVCGVCFTNGFGQLGGREMWILRYQGEKTPWYLPEFPTSIGKHILCQDCCPGNSSGVVHPCEKIVYPDQSVKPILTEAEFAADGVVKEIDYKKYCFVRASYTDYTTQVVNKGDPLCGQAGGRYDANLAVKSMIKEEH